MSKHYEAVALSQFPAPTRILVVDDMPDIQEVLKMYLEYRGAEVFVSGDGLDAIETAMARKPDVILMDMQIPGLNGYLATRRLRSCGYSGAIIAMTASDTKDGRE